MDPPAATNRVGLAPPREPDLRLKGANIRVASQCGRALVRIGGIAFSFLSLEVALCLSAPFIAVAAWV